MTNQNSIPSKWTLYTSAMYEGKPVQILAYYGSPAIDLDITYKVRKLDGTIDLVHRTEMSRYIL